MIEIKEGKKIWTIIVDGVPICYGSREVIVDLMAQFLKKEVS